MPPTDDSRLVPNAVEIPDEGPPRLVGGARRLEEAERLSNDVRMGILGDWWKRKNRGRSFELLEPNSNPVDLVEVIGDDQLARQVTVTCGLRQLEAVDATTINNIPAVVGLLRWGNDGHQTEAEIDFVDGTQITVEGSYVRLSAMIDRDAPGNGDPMPGVLAGAHIGYETPAVGPVTRTRYFVLDENPTRTLPIPPFANEVHVYRAGNPGSVLVELLDRSGAVIADTSTNGPIEFRLPNDARFVRVTNLEVLGAVGRLVFPLWL